ncbi:MAG: hypothetical protein ACSHYA_07580 [Opitutaceae bacterium]
MKSKIAVIQDTLKSFCRSGPTGCTLLVSETEKEKFKNEIPSGWEPFMVDHQTDWPDIYVIETNDTSRVSVWSDHAFVAEWQTIIEFEDWILTQTSKSLQSKTKT